MKKHNKVAGKFMFTSDDALSTLERNELVALRYVNEKGVPAEDFPMNPNGSKNAIAGLVSDDGRHLALMPHPER